MKMMREAVVLGQEGMREVPGWPDLVACGGGIAEEGSGIGGCRPAKKLWPCGCS
jgi:hypothetical protein